MAETNDLILKRIKYIRKSKRRSIHDCATILGLSNETYHGVERGTTSLSLPELELLAIYFGENPSDILSRDQPPRSYAAFLQEDLRQQFIQIRQKMLRALISQEREIHGITLEDLQEATQIPLETLQAYDTGTEPIAIDDLIKISTVLEIPLDALHEPLWPSKTDPTEKAVRETWHPEFEPDNKAGDPPLDEQYADVFKAFSRVSKEDQAFIAKYLLEKLRSE
ncbi:MAG: helix-turn-helix domain-containing protein [Brevefilum sp.]